MLTLLGRAVEALETGERALDRLRGDGTRRAVPAARPRRDRRRTLGRRPSATSRAPDAPTTPAPWCSSPTPRTARATSRRPSGSPAPPPRPSAIRALLCEALMVLGRSTFAADPEASDAVLRRVAQVAAEHGLRPGGCRPSSGWAATSTPRRPGRAFARRRARAGAGGGHARRRRADGPVARQRAYCSSTARVPALPLLRGAAERAGRLRLTGLQAMAELCAAIDAGLAGDEQP